MQGSPNFTGRVGHSVEGREIVARANFDLAGAPLSGTTLIIGGTHGDEPATIRLVESFGQSPAWSRVGDAPLILLLVICGDYARLIGKT